MKSFTFILLLFSSLLLFSQREVEKFSITFSKEEHEQVFKERLDTSFYYLSFEIGYENDSIQIKNGDKLLYAGRITTDDVTGAAEFLKYKKETIDQLYINVNNSKDLHIPLTQWNFILISFQGYYEISVRYSEFCPMYH